MKATRLPSGETRGWLIQPGGLVEDLADGILELAFAGSRPGRRQVSCRPAPSRPTGRPSRISRGATPPLTPTSASVPLRVNGPSLWRSSETAISPVAEIASTSAPTRPNDARLGAVRAGREELDRPSVPGGRVEDRLAVGREPRREDLAAPERQLLEGRRRDVPPSCRHGTRRRRRPPGRRPRASSAGPIQRERFAQRRGVRRRRRSAWRRPRAPRGRTRRRAPTRTAPPGSSRGSAARSGRARDGRPCWSARGPAAPSSGSP